MTPHENEFAESFLQGRVLFVDKPLHWTSFDAVNKIKSLLRYRQGIKKIRVGHAGTLDPLATGLLIICTGKATKQIDTYQGMDKTYTGVFVIGQTTPSSDLETTPGEAKPVGHITPGDLEKAAQALTGPQQQTPPLYSAKKINGERAYHHARQGLQTQMQPRDIRVESFEITRVNLPEVHFRITCSKGTYIRSLARDFGDILQTGAYLGALRRTHIGEFSVDNAWKMDDLSEAIIQGNL